MATRQAQKWRGHGTGENGYSPKTQMVPERMATRQKQNWYSPDTNLVPEQLATHQTQNWYLGKIDTPQTQNWRRNGTWENGYSPKMQRVYEKMGTRQKQNWYLQNWLLGRRKIGT